MVYREDLGLDPEDYEPQDIESHMILAAPSKELQKKAMDMVGIYWEEILCSIYRTKLGGKTFYVSWAQGQFVEDGKDVGFTTQGLMNYEALCLYPGKYTNLMVVELKECDLDLRLQVTYHLNRMEDLTRVCFFGDMEGELKGKLEEVFNVQSDERMMRMNAPLC